MPQWFEGRYQRKRAAAWSLLSGRFATKKLVGNLSDQRTATTGPIYHFPMKLSLRSRLAAMVLVIFLLAATIVGSAAIAWRQVRNLRRHFSGVRIESFRIADYLQANVLDLNATLLQFVVGHDPGDWQKFSLNAETLDRWLEQQQPGTPRERKDLIRIRSDLTAYRAEARAIAASSGIGQADVLAVLARIERASQQLLSLGYDLASAHRTAAAELVDASQKSLTTLATSYLHLPRTIDGT